MDIEFCPIGEKLEQIKNMLAFPDVDDTDWIVQEIREMLGIRVGMEPIEDACPIDSEPSVRAVKEYISLHNRAVLESMLLLEEHLKRAMRQEVDGLENHIDKAKLSIIRAVYAKDKPGALLAALVEKIDELQDTYIWKCHECGAECVWDAGYASDGGTPMCTTSQTEGDDEDENGDGCDIDMVPDRFALFDTEEWKEAEAYALRITNIKDSKEKKEDV
jgi:hypothetical protein